MNGSPGLLSQADDFVEAEGVAGHAAPNVHDHRRIGLGRHLENRAKLGTVHGFAHVVEQHANAQPPVGEVLAQQFLHHRELLSRQRGVERRPSHGKAAGSRAVEGACHELIHSGDGLISLQNP